MRRTIAIDIERLLALNHTEVGSSAPEPHQSTEWQLKTASNENFGRLLCLSYANENPHDGPAAN